MGMHTLSGSYASASALHAPARLRRVLSGAKCLQMPAHINLHTESPQNTTSQACLWPLRLSCLDFDAASEHFKLKVCDSCPQILVLLPYFAPTVRTPVLYGAVLSGACVLGSQSKFCTAEAALGAHQC